MAVNFYGLTKIDFRLPKNALWDARIAQWLVVSNESLKAMPTRSGCVKIASRYRTFQE